MTARNRLKRLRNKKLIDFAPDSPRRGAMVVYVATEQAASAKKTGRVEEQPLTVNDDKGTLF